MTHPYIDNETPYAASLTFLQDGELETWAVVLVQATYDVVENGERGDVGVGHCVLADEQPAVSLGGTLWGADPAVSSYKDEPQIAWRKVATDVVLRGTAQPPHPAANRMEVSLAVGPVRKSLLVTGERVWFKHLGAIVPSAPLPLSPTPLRYEEAFGGWDRKDADPGLHSFEAHNPVGLGFAAQGPFIEGVRLPRIEDPRRPLRGWGDRAAPAGFGVVSPAWATRTRWAGTYDQTWWQSRAPRLPLDLQPAFFNAASPELIAPGHLRGDEPVLASGVTARGTWAFSLPGAPPPTVRLERRQSHRDVTLTSPGLDTVTLDADAQRISLLWRYGAPLAEGPHELRTINVT